MNFLPNNEIDLVSDTVAAGLTTIITDTVNMSQNDGVTFLVPMVSILDTGVITITAQGGDQSDGSDATDLTGAIVTYTAPGTVSSKLLAIELFRPLQAFVRLSISRTVANSALGIITAIKSSPSNAPIIQSPDVLDSLTILSPASSSS